jgi:hypothetical protein
MPKYIPTNDDLYGESDDDNQFGILSSSPFSNDQTITTDKFVIVEQNGVVAINGFRLNGFVDTRECTTCGLRIRVFDIDYDQYFCPDCNQWVEGWCSDPDCTFCGQEHPSRPLPVFGIDESTYPKRTGIGWSRFKFIEIDA